MNFPELQSYEDQAIDTVVSVINRAKEKLGFHQTLKQLIETRHKIADSAFVALQKSETPTISNSENFIRETIEKKWKLTDVFMYSLKYIENSRDNISDYYYYMVTFSQPTEKYPIPQATVAVYFKVQEKHLELQQNCGVPLMSFRLEGQTQYHDVRFVKLKPDWILGILMMKIKFFKRIEAFDMF